MLVPVPVPLSTYARALAGASFDEEVPYWQALAERELVRLPFDGTAPEDRGTVATESHVVTHLDAEVTSQLLRGRVDDALLAALAHAIEQWAGTGTLLVDVETHGRDLLDLDLSRTVGWLTAIHPLPLELRGETEHASIGRIRALRDQVPRGGAAWLALRTTGGLRDVPRADVLFNYLGQLDRSLRGRFITGISTDACESERARENRRTHALEINAYVRAGALTIDLAFDLRQLRPRTAERLAAAIGETLHAFAASTELITEGAR
jgi:non-ribosomal peptide synthase protein (TIGR01720 family)